MTFTASPQWSRDLPPFSSTSEKSPVRGEALLSRSGCNERSPHMETDSSVARLRFDRFELDEAEARLTCAGEPLALAPKPFAVLCALARTPGRLVTKNALLDLVWGHRFVTESVLKTAISEVRAALDDDPKQPRYIETVSRRGYRFIAATVVASSQRTPAIERNVAAGRDHPALTALTALFRGAASLAELIRAVAATLAREPLVLNDSWPESLQSI